MQLHENISRENIIQLMRLFYSKAMKDDNIGHYFLDTLGDEMNNALWRKHIDLLTDFWLTILAVERCYERDPYTPHVDLPALKREDFSQWKQLFFTSVDELYIPQIAERFKKKGEMFSKRFMRNLNL